MKTKQIGIVFLFLIHFGIESSKAQSFDLLFNNREPVSYQLSTLKMLTFNATYMIVHQCDGSNVSLDLAAIRTLFFSDVVAGNEPISVNNHKVIILFPNPARNTITIMNLPDTQNDVVFYRLDGSILKKVNLSDHESSVDIQTFPSGLSLVKINNQVIKFIKL
jgi:hypothetical protein